MSIETGDNVQLKRTYYTESVMSTAAPTLDSGLEAYVSSVTDDSLANCSIISQTNSNIKVGDGSTTFDDLKYENELFLGASGDITLSNEFGIGQVFNIYYNEVAYSSSITISYTTTASTSAQVLLAPKDSARFIKIATGLYILIGLSSKNGHVLEYTSSADQTCDLTSGYLEGATVLVRNRKAAGYYVNIDIGLTDNIPLGAGYSLKLWLESDGWHCEVTEIDFYTDTNGFYVKKQSNGETNIVGYYETGSNTATVTNWFGTSSGTSYYISETFTFDEEFQEIPAAIVSSNGAAAQITASITSVDVTIMNGTTFTSRKFGINVIGLWTTQTMLH